MRTVHKILILAAALAAGSALVNYFIFDVQINWWAVLVCGLVIVNNLRELQFEDMKYLINVERYNSAIVVDAIRKEYGAEGVRRIENRSIDTIVERAPADIREEAVKVAEAIKKLNNKEVN